MIDQPYNSALALTASDSTDVQPGLVLSVNCTVAGNVSVKMASGTTLIFRVEEGQSWLPLAVFRVNSTGTTATATYYNVYAK